MKMASLVIVLLFGMGSIAIAGSGKDGPDRNNGGGNEPHAPGQTSNPNPGKLFNDTIPTWLDGFVLAAGDNVAPGSGNWGGGPGNSGPGDKNGQNAKSKDGGQTPHDDK